MKAVAYYRVSTAAQGRSGLGLDAQRESVERFCQGRGWEIVAPPFTEVESGKRADRPELVKALHRAKVTGATLVVAKLDRLSRNAAFLMTLKDSGVAFVAADLPGANNMTVGVMALVAQQEREATSTRTKEALASAKARAAANGVGIKADGVTRWKTGARLGNPNGAAALKRAGKGNADGVKAVMTNAAARAADMAPVIDDMRANGITSLERLATALNDGGFVTARGGRWHASTVRNLLGRLERST
jgi:DNA invertase Pin-like site-specific DNA recombinase